MSIADNMMADVEAMVRLLEHPAGFTVGVFNLLAYRLENGLYALDWEQDDRTTQALYENAVDAAGALIQMRIRLRLGYDYEVEPKEKP